jgi:hypothetical protein
MTVTPAGSYGAKRAPGCQRARPGGVRGVQPRASCGCESIRHLEARASLAQPKVVGHVSVGGGKRDAGVSDAGEAAASVACSRQFHP